MKVFLENREFELFRGAKVRDLVRSYSMALVREIEEGRKVVVDHHGDEVSLDGRLSENQVLNIHNRVKNASEASDENQAR